MSAEKEDRKPDIRVVGATVDLDGETLDVVAIAPPEAASLAEDPEAFRDFGGMAVRQVVEGTAHRAAGDEAFTVMMNDAGPGGYTSRVVASSSLVGVVSRQRLEAAVNHDLSGNSQ
jgi:hypothetical protein